MQFVVEERVEGLGELASDLAVVTDVEPLEDPLVELSSDGRRGRFVGSFEIGRKVEGAPKVREDEGVLTVGRSEALLDVGELASDPRLLGLQQVEGYSFGVVRL